MFRCNVTVQLLLPWVPQETLSGFSVFNVVKCRLDDDSLYQKLLILNQDTIWYDYDLHSRTETSWQFNPTRHKL